MLSRSMKGLKRWLGCAATACWLGVSPLSLPQAHADDKADLKALLQRLDKLEKQNEDLKRRLLDIEQPVQDKAGAVVPAADEVKASDPLKKAVDDYLKEKDKKKQDEEDKKKKQLEKEGSLVGSDLKLNLRWDNGFTAETADKAFRMHMRGRLQMDTVFYQAGTIVQYANNGIGRVDDGIGFRRARLAAEGTWWEVFDFTCEYDFMNTDTLANNVVQTKNADGVVTNAVRSPRIINVPVATDAWIQWRNPIMNVRMGNLKPAIGFEHNTSSRFLNFLERSYAFDAYVGGPDNGFTPGVLFFRNFHDDRIHFSSSVCKWTQTIFSSNAGDGEWSTCVRAGAFPVYTDEGRCAVWIGCAGRHADGDFLVNSNRQFTGQTDGQFRIRARTELRNGTAETHTPLLDVFPFGSSQDTIAPEFAAVFGPWTIQAEYFANWIHDARANANDPRGNDFFSQAAYVEVLYFLTGENRVFNRQLPGFGRVVPYENAWFVRGDDHRFCLGRGAWQVGARYSWIDTRDPDNPNLGGNNTVGSAQCLTLGLNWFTTPNSKLQWNYTYEQRYQVNRVSSASPNFGLLPTLPSNGELHGFGMRLAFDW